MDVIATVWKKPYYAARNQAVIEAGVNVLRVKCSHWGARDISEALQRARAQINACGHPVKLLADLPESKIRLGEFPQNKVDVEKGVEFRFLHRPASSDPNAYIPFRLENLGAQLSVGDEFYLGDGVLAFRVTQIHSPNEFIAQTLNKGRLIQCTAITIPHLMDTIDHVTPFLDEMIPELVHSKPDLVAFSFVKSAPMLRTLKNKLEPFLAPDWQPQIIAKIESAEGVASVDEILDLADGIMVARGDLALNADYAKMGLIQKRLVAKARQAGKYVIVATGALQSMLNNHLPNRSDITDVTNAFLDGASAIMLCAETAHNETPERAVEVAKRIIEAVEHPETP